jgi:hypothetical protein
VPVAWATRLARSLSNTLTISETKKAIQAHAQRREAGPASTRRYRRTPGPPHHQAWR